MAEVKAFWFDHDGDKVTIGQMRREYHSETYYNQRVELTRDEAAILAAKLLRFAATDET